MTGVREVQAPSLQQAIELFKARFLERYPRSQFLVDGDGYEDEHVDLIVYADGDPIELERFAAEVSLEVQAATSLFVLPFVQPATGRPG